MHLTLALAVLFLVAESFQLYRHNHHLIHVNRHKFHALSTMAKLSMTQAKDSDATSMPSEQETMEPEKTGQNSLANGELNPIYSNGMEEITSPNTGFTEQKGAFDIGLLVAFPIMIGTLGFFLFFPYVAPQLAANSP